MLITITAIAGAALYRWRGHASKYKRYFPRPFNQIAFALPYAIVVYLQTSNWAVSGVVLAVSTLGVLTGHGNFFNNKTFGKKLERLEPLIIWLRPRIPMKLYKFIGMLLTGLAVSISSGIALQNPLLAISGALKGAAYFIVDDTEESEWITGGVLWGSLALLAF